MTVVRCSVLFTNVWATWAGLMPAYSAPTQLDTSDGCGVRWSTSRYSRLTNCDGAQPAAVSWLRPLSGTSRPSSSSTHGFLFMNLLVSVRAERLRQRGVANGGGMARPTW